MIYELDPKFFYEGSFADEKVSKVIFDYKSKIMNLEVRGCETEDEKGRPLFYKNLSLEIFDWWQLEVYKLNPDTNHETLLDYKQIDFLDEILIYTLSEEMLILEGFGKETSAWIKLKFTKPKIRLLGHVDRERTELASKK